jgi:hypothetical protein
VQQPDDNDLLCHPDALRGTADIREQQRSRCPCDGGKQHDANDCCEKKSSAWIYDQRAKEKPPAAQGYEATGGELEQGF